jgi:DNA-binding transcriptional LysR family regulator
MTLQQLRYLLCAARAGSFAAAADELFVTQPAVAEQVRRLERELGGELFVRTRRGLTPTPAAQALLPFAEQALAACAAGAEAVREVATLATGTASLGVPRNADLYALEDLALAMHERHPGVDVRLVGQSSADVADAVRAGRLEAGLVVLPIDDSLLEVEPLLRDEVLYASRDLAPASAPVPLERLLDAPLVLYDAYHGNRDPTRRQLNERLQALGGRLHARIEVEYLRGALELVRRGVGATIVARAAVEAGVVPPEVRTAPFAEPLYDVLAIVRPRGRRLSPATRELLRIARERVERTRSGTGRAAAHERPAVP